MMPRACLISHHELAHLRSKTTRARWQQRGEIPRPLWVRADRFDVGLYPDAVLARLVAPGRAEPAITIALRAVAAGCEALYETKAFGEMAVSAKRVLGTLDGWDLSVFYERMAEEDRGILEACCEEIDSFEAGLREYGIAVEAQPGVVVEVDDAVSCVADAAGGILQVLRSHRITSSDMDVGQRVALDRVRIGSYEQTFLLPEPAIFDRQPSDVPRKEVTVDNHNETRLDEISRRTTLSNWREEAGLSGSGDDPRRLFDAGFVLELHAHGDPLPSAAPTESLAFRVPARSSARG